MNCMIEARKSTNRFHTTEVPVKVADFIGVTRMCYELVLTLQ